MSQPVYFTVVADYQAFIEDASSDSDYDPQSVPVGGTVTFTPLVNSGDVVRALDAEPRPVGYIAAPVTAVIDQTDGRLKLRTSADSGGAGTFAPVRLLASTDLLELDGPLFYRVAFSNIVYANGRRGSITGFVFEAPATDTEVNLIEVGRVAGQAAANLVRPTVAVGTVTASAPGSDAVVTNSGTSTAGVFDFTLPRGDTGPAATVAVGLVSTGNAGSSATVTNSGTSGAAVLDFTIPRGDKGDKGDTGNTGATGAAATVAVGTVATGAAGTSTTITNSGSSGAAVLNFTIPRGDPGEVTFAGVQTLTNKDLSSATNTFPSSLVTLTGTQSMSNKTIVSPTLTGTITGAADATTVTSGKVITGGVLSTQIDGGAGYFMAIPRLYNDLSSCTIRAGGALTMMKNGGTPVLSTDYIYPDGLFAPGGYPTFLLNTISTDTWVLEVTIPTGVDLSYGAHIGISMPNGYRAKDVTIEVYFNSAWSTTITSTNQASGEVWKYYSSGAYVPSKIRYTLTNFATTQCRIVSLYAVSGASPLASGSLLPRTGGALYGTNAAPPTLTATGADTNISLNLVPKGTGTVNAGGVPLVTTTGSQALSNKTWTSAGVPSTATSTGTVGQIAYDSSYVYICTATNVWRRAALASW